MKAGNTTLNKFLKRPLKMSIPIYQRKYIGHLRNVGNYLRIFYLSVVMRIEKVISLGQLLLKQKVMNY